jgi:hypothetical protein
MGSRVPKVPPAAALLPDVEDLRALSATVAEAVYRTAVDEGVATKKHDDVGKPSSTPCGCPNTTEKASLTTSPRALHVGLRAARRRTPRSLWSRHVFANFEGQA